PGFVIQDEISPGQVFDRAGALAMANKGITHSASAQFFITVSGLPNLNGQYTIFGTCDDEHVVRGIARELDAGKQPAPVIQSIAISRD
ncbi:MAG: peptidylprolyl isomerase, partial [Nannocystaceae bacterium]